MSSQELTRRNFLRTGTAIAGGTALALKPEKGSAGTFNAHLPLSPDPGRGLRFGIIGCGGRGRAHLNAINLLPDDCEIAAVCDLLPKRVENFIQEAHGNPKGYSDYKKMLDHPGLNAVCIVTPHHLHASMTVDALNAGLDVVCEKPMALTVEECDDMNFAASSNNRILMIGHQLRFHPQYQTLKEEIEKGTIGELKIIWSALFRGNWAPGKNWLKYMDQGGSGLLSMSCHEFDLFYWLTGSYVDRVSGFGGNAVYLDQDTVDHANITLEYEDGTKCSHGFSLFGGGYSEHILFGSKAIIRFPRGGRHYFIRKVGRGEKETRIDIGHKFTGDLGDATLGLHKGFVEAVRTRVEPLTSGRASREACVVALAGDRAIETGRVINAKSIR